MIRPPILTALFALLMTACATPASSPQSQSALRDKESALLSTSRIELVYVLGHVHRRDRLAGELDRAVGAAAHAHPPDQREHRVLRADPDGEPPEVQYAPTHDIRIAPDSDLARWAGGEYVPAPPP